VADHRPARDYLGGRDRISRKVLYNAVKRGLKVARLGESGRRMLFSAQWIDEYLAQQPSHASTMPTVINRSVTDRESVGASVVNRDGLRAA